MITSRTPEAVSRLVRDLLALPRETTWLEFKHDNSNPETIGEYVSALSNAATLADRSCGYLIWGIEDGTRAVVGTKFSPHIEKKGNEDLEPWLHRLLTPPHRFEFFETIIDGKSVVVLEVDRARRQPVQFHGQEYVRVGSHKKRLKDLPEKERELWRIFDRSDFEEQLARDGLTDEEITELLDYTSYFTLTNQRVPESRAGILDALVAEKFVRRALGNGWGITNLGAVLFAKKLDAFPTVWRKALRVIVYEGTNRIRTKKEHDESMGYASGFSQLVKFIMALVPANEEIERSLRKSVPMYPELAVRELVANALIHQDFFVTGAGPTVEIFDDRIEITNPGTPLVDVERFLDNPPRSRNETMAALMGTKD